MYMKPAQKIKRLLRMMVVRENNSGQQSIKMFGYIHPKKEETSGCKFTSFFRQITVVNARDKSVIETVNRHLSSGKNLQLPSWTKTE
jgi:hypothetical protein